MDNSDWLKTSIETCPGKHDNKDCWIIKATYVANRFENGDIEFSRHFQHQLLQ